MLRIAPFVFALLASISSQASIINVPQDQPTIQAGINAASNGDTVLVAPGTYVENINFLGKAITVTSSGGPKVTIIDGDAANPVAAFVTKETASSVLHGFTLQNGVATLDFNYTGGGVSINNASPTITGNVIQNCSAFDGGGIGVASGGPTIRGNTIQLNYGQFGGGLVFGRGANGNVIHNTIRRNSAQNGAGLELYGAGNLLIEANKIVDNGPALEGGGIDIMFEADEVIVQNVIARNRASTGSQIASLISDSVTGFTLINNTIVSAFNGGADAAILADGFTRNVIIENNVINALGDQSAILCNYFYPYGPPIVEFNDAFNPKASYSGMCTGFDGTNGNISSSPKFVNGAAKNYQLSVDSPAVNAGSDSAPHLPTKDFDGNPRIVGGTIDLGAYEVQ